MSSPTKPYAHIVIGRLLFYDIALLSQVDLMSRALLKDLPAMLQLARPDEPADRSALIPIEASVQRILRDLDGLLASTVLGLAALIPGPAGVSAGEV
jgi:hypothetical protein